MATILVTGGAGFLGSHLCEFLSKKHDVWCMDSLLTGDRGNLEGINANFVNHDITLPFPKDLPEPEFIFNLASPASPRDYQAHPIETLMANALGVKNVLDYALECNARVLHTSTSEVYGDPLEHPQKETYWGNVNPIGLRSCFSADTELLTKAGWKLFEDITKEDEIATLNSRHEIEYHKPLEIIKQAYHGEMIRFQNYHCDLLVTPNHKMYIQQRSERKKEKFRLLPAFEAINWDRARMLKVANYDNTNVEFFHFPENIDRRNSKTPPVEKIKMDDWLEFFGYYITEGCVSIRKRHIIRNDKTYTAHDYRILIAQAKKNKKNYNKIKRCLERLPFNFSESYDHQFCITNKQLANYLLQFGKSYEKYVPRELLQVSKRQLKILFNAMMLGDGTRKGDQYYSNSHRLISDFQEILLKIGYAGNIAMHDKRKKRPLYQIHLLNRFNKKYARPSYSMRKIENYEGLVYCVSVPNHVIFVRRKGKALFCGNCYDEGKRFAEALFMAYYREKKSNIVMVRIFNTYGPRMRPGDGRVVPNFIVQALSNEPLTIYGSGKQTRSFCYVGDLVEGLAKLAFSKHAGDVFNLGNPNEYTMLELAEIIKREAGSSSKISFKPLPSDDPRKRMPDIAKIRKAIGWEPKTTLKEGIQKTVAWFKEKM